MWPIGDMARCVLLRIRRTHADALMWGLRDASLQFPTQRHVDGPLLYGSALFGIGWAAGRALHGTRIAERVCVTAVQAGVRGRFVIAMLIGRRLHLRYRRHAAHDPLR